MAFAVHLGCFGLYSSDWAQVRDEWSVEVEDEWRYSQWRPYCAMGSMTLLKAVTAAHQMPWWRRVTRSVEDSL